MKKTIASALFITALIVNGLFAQNGDSAIVLAQGIESPLVSAAKDIVSAAYDRIGIDIEYKLIPGQRSLVMANDGVIDGNVIRADTIPPEYTDLIMVPTPLIQVEMMVFTKLEDVVIEDYSSLRPYLIGFRRGVVVAEKGTEGMNRRLTDTLDQAFLMLDADRLDMVLSDRLAGMEIVSKLNLEGIHIVAPPLYTRSLYHYLHKKHAAIVPLLDKAFQEMIKEGLIENIEEKMESSTE